MRKNGYNMKLLFLSDIHGITKNLKKVMMIIQQEHFDKIIVLGDLYQTSYYDNMSRNDQQVLELLNSLGNRLIVLKGNCDSNDIVKNSPFLIEDLKILEVDGFFLYLNHGNLYRYLKNDTFTNGVMVYGHEHIPYIKKESDMIYINTGSISLPRDDFGATYTIYENREFKIYQVDTKNVIFQIKVD